MDAKKALPRTLEVKRKATEIQEDVAAHKERTRRVTNEHARAESHVNDGIGSLARAVQAAAKATHSLTCGVARPREQRDQVLEGGDRAHCGVATPTSKWTTNERPSLRTRRSNTG